jgi:hypothetical protein
MPLFGTDGLINHVTLIFGALYSLGALIFRKSVANDLLDFKFSVIGSIASSMLAFIITDSFFENIKILVVVSLIAFFAGGFGLGEILPDGEAGGHA